MTDKILPLQNTFTHTNSTHSFEIKWTQMGDASKPPLIFIHGTPWSCAEWQELASVLKDHYCIYLYDHPGFEHSPQPSRQDGAQSELDPGLTLRAQASAALIQHWNLSQPPHIVAHDNGGLVSLRLFLEHDVKFASLCLIDVVAMQAEKVAFFDLVSNNQAVFQAIPANLMEGFIRAYIKAASYKGLSTETENLLAAQWLEGGAQGCTRFLQEMEQAHHRDIGGLEKRYSEVGSQIPVKIIWGADDSWVPAERAHQLFKALNAREIKIIEEAGHLVQFDQPSKLAFEVGTWLMKQN